MAEQIAGRVRDEAGRGIADARVSIAAGPVPVPEVAILTELGGEFRLSVPVAGQYQLVCAADGYQTAQVTVEVPRGGASGLDVGLQHAAP